MKINKQKLYELYMLQVEDICEICDWKTHFGPEEIVSLIADIIEQNEDVLIEPIQGQKNESKDQGPTQE